MLSTIELRIQIFIRIKMRMSNATGTAQPNVVILLGGEWIKLPVSSLEPRAQHKS
jgi:hypothetical protein